MTAILITALAVAAVLFLVAPWIAAGLDVYLGWCSDIQKKWRAKIC